VLAAVDHAVARAVCFLQGRSHVTGKPPSATVGRFPAGWHDRHHPGRAESVEPCAGSTTSWKMAFEFPFPKCASALGATGVVVVLPRKVCNMWPVLSGSDITRLGARQARRWWPMA
jgi:hypothetical protein